MITFKFNNATITAPDCWEEVTVEYFIKPEFLAQDSISLLAALSGIDRKTLLNATEDIMGSLNKMVEFYVKDPKGYQRGSTKHIKLRGKRCKVPQDIELLRIGQKIMFQQAMFKNPFIYQSIPEAVAIYMVPEVNDGDFDDALIPELTEEILKLPISDVYPIADFFLDSFKQLVTSGRKSSTQFPQQTKTLTTTTTSLEETDSKSTENSP